MRPATYKQMKSFKGTFQGSYIVEILNLEIIRNFKLIFSAEYILMTACNINETLVSNTADENSKRQNVFFGFGLFL